MGLCTSAKSCWTCVRLKNRQESERLEPTKRDAIIFQVSLQIQGK